MNNLRIRRQDGRAFGLIWIWNGDEEMEEVISRSNDCLVNRRVGR